MVNVLYEHGDLLTIQARVIRSFLKPHSSESVAVCLELVGPSKLQFVCTQDDFTLAAPIVQMSSEELAAKDALDAARQEREKKDAASSRRVPLLLPSWRENLDSLSRTVPLGSPSTPTSPSMPAPPQ